MNENTNGDHAFPTDGMNAHHGMTLRDYFAGCAMRGLLANPNVKSEVDCSRFYSWADSMLAERTKP